MGFQKFFLALLALTIVFPLVSLQSYAMLTTTTTTLNSDTMNVTLNQNTITSLRFNTSEILNGTARIRHFNSTTNRGQFYSTCGSGTLRNNFTTDYGEFVKVGHDCEEGPAGSAVTENGYYYLTNTSMFAWRVYTYPNSSTYWGHSVAYVMPLIRSISQIEVYDDNGKTLLNDTNSTKVTHLKYINMTNGSLYVVMAAHLATNISFYDGNLSIVYEGANWTDTMVLMKFYNRTVDLTEFDKTYYANIAGHQPIDKYGYPAIEIMTKFGTVQLSNSTYSADTTSMLALPHIVGSYQVARSGTGEVNWMGIEFINYSDNYYYITTNDSINFTTDYVEREGDGVVVVGHYVNTTTLNPQPPLIPFTYVKFKFYTISDGLVAHINAYADHPAIRGFVFSGYGNTNYVYGSHHLWGNSSGVQENASINASTPVDYLFSAGACTQYCHNYSNSIYQYRKYTRNSLGAETSNNTQLVGAVYLNTTNLWQIGLGGNTGRLPFTPYHYLRNSPYPYIHAYYFYLTGTHSDNLHNVAVSIFDNATSVRSFVPRANVTVGYNGTAHWLFFPAAFRNFTLTKDNATGTLEYRYPVNLSSVLINGKYDIFVNGTVAILPNITNNTEIGVQFFEGDYNASLPRLSTVSGSVSISEAMYNYTRENITIVADGSGDGNITIVNYIQPSNGIIDVTRDGVAYSNFTYSVSTKTLVIMSSYSRRTFEIIKTREVGMAQLYKLNIQNPKVKALIEMDMKISVVAARESHKISIEA